MLPIENKLPAFNNSMFKRYLYCSIDLDIMTLINMTLVKYKKDQTCQTQKLSARSRKLLFFYCYDLDFETRDTQT